MKPGVLPVLEAWYTPDSFANRSSAPVLFRRLIASLSAAIAKPLKVNTSAPSATIALGWVILFLEHPAYGSRSSSAAARCAVAQKFLDALARIDFRGIDIAF